MNRKLDAGTTFPELTLSVVHGGEFTLPHEIGSAYQIVLFYRGHW